MPRCCGVPAKQYHQRIAQVLEARFPALCETQPELLAHHYTEAGLSAPAVDCWQRAGQRAIERSAHVEAIRHLTRGVGRDRTAARATCVHVSAGPPTIPYSRISRVRF